MCFEDNPIPNLLSTTINGIKLEEVIVERLYYSLSMPSSINSSFYYNYCEWTFVVGIYKSGDDFYLCLTLNDHSSAVDYMIDLDQCPNSGIVSITEELSEKLIYKFNELGKEFFVNQIPDFEFILTNISAIIPCDVILEALMHAEGYYIDNHNLIVVANNNSQFGIIFSLIHEVAHYFLNKSNIITKEKISTIRDYILNIEENICNCVAVKILEYLFPDFNRSCFEEDLMQANLITKDIFDDYSASKIEKTAMLISKEFIELYEAQLQKTDYKTKNYIQSGLVKLSIDDNNKLYDIVMNEISNLLPDDEDVF